MRKKITDAVNQIDSLILYLLSLVGNSSSIIVGCAPLPQGLEQPSQPMSPFKLHIGTAIYIYMFLSIYLSIYLSIHPSILVSFNLSIYDNVRPSPISVVRPSPWVMPGDVKACMAVASLQGPTTTAPGDRIGGLGRNTTAHVVK